MLQLPKILTDIVQKTIGIRCLVTETEYLDTNLKRIRFRGDFHHTSFIAGQAVKFRVSLVDFRHYTPIYFNQAEGICDILFYLHGRGPGNTWASALETGHMVELWGTGIKRKLLTDNRYHFFFGDETSLGIFHALKEVIHQNNQEYLGVLELAPDAFAWPEKIGLSLDTVPRTPGQPPGYEAINYLNDLQGRLWNTWVNASFYLMGRDASIQAFRQALLAKGVNNHNITTRAYWCDEKKGL